MSTLYVNTLTPNSGDTVSVSGSLFVSGNITLGDANTDGIAFAADVSSSIIPDAHNTYDLGTSSSSWRNVYGTASVALFSATSTTSSHAAVAAALSPTGQSNITQVGQLSSITVNGNTVLGNASSSAHTFNGHITASGNISASGTVFADNFQSTGGDDTITFVDNVVTTGSITATLGVTGSLLGTSSYAVSASKALSASYSLSASFAQTASYVVQAISSSYASNSTSASQANVTPQIIVTDNENANENNVILFSNDGSGSGFIRPEADGHLIYNPSQGRLTSPDFGNITGASRFTGSFTGSISGILAGSSSYASVAQLAATVTITDNESTNENNALIFTAGGDLDGGNLGLESDGTLSYNPSTGKVTATGFVGALTGNADTATVATTVTITDNESTNENNALIFTAGGDLDGGNLGLESDGTLSYNPSTGKVTATGFVGALTGQADTSISSSHANVAHTASFLAPNIVEQSGTAAEDLTGVIKDTIWYANTAQAGAITLPQATAANAGMVIKIIVGTTNWSTTAFKLGFANGGSTVLTGYIRLGSNAGSEAVDGFVVTANAKSLEIDADDATAAGGAIGSTYTFTYLEANLVHVEANGQVTTGTPALDAGASTTAGI